MIIFSEIITAKDNYALWLDYRTITNHEKQKKPASGEAG
jgi:hypothetical protein